MRSVRSEAYKVLLLIFKDKAYSNITLDQALKQSALAERDKAFASRLVYGTVERTLSLDYIIKQFLDQPVQKLKLQVLVNLRMAVYQLYFMDKVPQSAVIDEAVKLSKETGCAFASGLVNAVLRKIADNPVCLEEMPPHIRYSCPEHLMRMWTKMYGQANTLGILETMNEPVPLHLRVNTLKTDCEALLASFAGDGLQAKQLPLSNGVELTPAGGITSLKQYKEGLFHVQDLASQLCVEALCPQPGETVYDLCAAPGGKAFTIAQKMDNTGVVYAFDLYEHRLELIEKGADRLGIANLKTAVGDASLYNGSLPLADRVLCDVPCSGLGIIRKKPEIRYKELDTIKQLPSLQLAVLENGARYVKPCGTLVYSTCALNKKENDQVADAFLAKHPEYTAVPVLPETERASSERPYLTLFPHLNGTDGFFIAKFERSGVVEAGY